MAHDDPHPIATATIARIYLKQGLLEQAEALYRDLLRRRPGDPELERGLGEVLRRRGEQRAPVGDDRVSVELGDGTVVCRWLLTEEGKGRAERVLEGPGRPALRLVGFPRERGVAPRDVLVEQREGNLSFRAPRRARLLAAALGLLGEGDRFVAITHSEAVTLPEPEPRSEEEDEPRRGPRRRRR